MGSTRHRAGDGGLGEREEGVAGAPGRWGPREEAGKG